MNAMGLDKTDVGVHAYSPPQAVVCLEASASTLEGPVPAPPYFKGMSGYGLDDEDESFSATCNTAHVSRLSAEIKGKCFDTFQENLSPLDEFIREICEKTATERKAKAAYRERIEELNREAVLDNLAINQSSERAFWAFMDSLKFFRKGTVFLLDNGNLRAVWKSNTGDQIGLQFIDQRTIQYVLFKYRDPRAEYPSRVAGRDTLDGVRRQIAALDLSTLLSA